MNGEIDHSGRALLPLVVRSNTTSAPMKLQAWVDTAFTGELLIPRTLITALGLPKSSSVIADLADGSESVLDTFSCIVEWFGALRVVESEVRLPLLGVGLLQDRRLIADYRPRELSLD